VFHRASPHRTALLATIATAGLLIGGSALAATSADVTETVTPAPTISVSDSYGTVASGAYTASSSDTAITFPSTVSPSSAQTVTSTDDVGLTASIDNPASGSTWTLSASSAGLSDSGSDTIPASAITIPETAYIGSSASSMTASSLSSSALALSSTVATAYQNLSTSDPVLAIAPTLTIPENQTAGSYTGTIDFQVGLTS
jgi:hypothetical protein